MPLEVRALWRDRTLSRLAYHEIAICAIFREEAPFLADWIAFHRHVGVTKFFLYNNFSTDNFRDVLAPFVEDGTVFWYDWPVQVGQLPAYRHCVKHHWQDALWIAFIDIDEFLFPSGGGSLIDYLCACDGLSGVHVWQAFFGSSGYERRPDLPVPYAA